MATDLTTVATPPGLDPVILLDEPLYEIIDEKEVTQPPMGLYEAAIINRLGRRLGNFAEEHDLGQVMIEVLFRLKPGRSSMRRPDVAFVSFDRWSRDLDFSSANGWDVVPDLAVEVVSPTDLAVEVMAKVYGYLEVGVREVWLLYPELRRVHRFGTAGPIASLGPDGTLDGGALLPGFGLSLVDLFRTRA